MERYFHLEQAASRFALSSGGSGESDDSESKNSDEISQPRKRKATKKHLIDQRIVSALDAYRISDRAAFHLIAAVLISLGFSINDFVISRDSIRTARKKERHTIACNVKQNLKVNNVNEI